MGSGFALADGFNRGFLEGGEGSGVLVLPLTIRLILRLWPGADREDPGGTLAAFIPREVVF